MSDFINTVSVIGDMALTDSILDESITEIVDEYVTTLKAYAFSGCGSLTKAVFKNVTTMGADAVAGLSALTELQLPALQTGFSAQNCSSLKEISLPSYVGDLMFWGCKSLTKVDGGMASSLRQFAFYQAGSLTTLILRKTDGICTMPYANTVGGGVKVYVPKALHAEYKSASNWSAIANNIYAIEDYPEITGG